MIFDLIDEAKAHIRKHVAEYEAAQEDEEGGN